MKLRDIKAKAAKRRAHLRQMRDKGLTLEEIGAKLKISKQRVSQILGKAP